VVHCVSTDGGSLCWRSGDRFWLTGSVYSSPLQIYAFSNLPGVFRQPFSRLLHIAIISCSAIVFYVWLKYRSDADA